MGNNLFGVNISGLIHKHVSPGVLKAVLRKFTDEDATGTGASILSPKTKTPVNHDCNGFVETFDQDVDNVNGTPIQEDDRQVIIIGDSLPAGIIPKKNDEIDIEGSTFKVLALIERDPDAATYNLHVRK